jgi:adenosylcobinamide-GDP ribazoletransferase
MNGQSLASHIRREVNSFIGALMFLTRVPVSRYYVFRAEDLPRSATYFPIVGLLIGLLAGLVLFCAELLVPPILAVLFCMGTAVLITGALHEDGLADAADGLIGGREPIHRLEIMKDSRVGSYGMIVLWFSLTAKLLLLNALLERGVYLAVCALVVAHGLGRAGTVALLFACKYVRTKESKGGPFGNCVRLKELAAALPIPVVISILLLGKRAVLSLVLAAGATWAAGAYFKKSIGGITGDCLGAANQLIELVCYISLVAGSPRWLIE